MEQNVDPIKEIFEELFGLLEAMETQSMAVLQFLKDQRIASDKKLGPYLESAGNASSVKWRAARVRMEYLLSSIQKEPRQEDKKSSEAGAQKADEPAKDNEKRERPKEQGQSSEKESAKEQAQEPEIKSSDKAPNRPSGSGNGSPKTAKAGVENKAASAAAGSGKKAQEKESKRKNS